MKYAIAVLLVVLALIPSSASQALLDPNIIMQSNTQNILSQINGSVYEQSANWAAIVGDGNRLAMNHIQNHFNRDAITIYDNSTTGLVIIGNNNKISQTSDPGSMVGLVQINELILIGNNSDVAQSNFAEFNSINNGTITQYQKNFALMLGDNTALDQSNIAFAEDDDTGNISQREVNTAYVYGSNSVTQFNSLSANITMNSNGYVNQTAENLAFVISDNMTPMLTTSVIASIRLLPMVNNSTQMLSMPTVPSLPYPPAVSMRFPIDL